MSAPFAQCGDWGICLAIIQISWIEILNYVQRYEEYLRNRHLLRRKILAL